MKKYLTVVFEHDGNSKLVSELLDNFCNLDGVDYRDTKITAISTEDEISRIESIEDVGNYDDE